MFLRNNADRMIEGCGLAVAMLSSFQKSNRAFVTPQVFHTIELIEPQNLKAKQASAKAYLARLNHPGDQYVSIVDARGRIQPHHLTEAGIWKAVLHIFTSGSHGHQEEVCFEWKPGSRPIFVADPTLH